MQHSARERRRANVAFAITTELHTDVANLYEALCQEGDQKEALELVKTMQSKLRSVRSDLSNDKTPYVQKDQQGGQ